jgi:chemotaxis protein methyltransferase CheR
MVRFRQFNLLDSYGWLDDLDIIYCRNVLLYFDHRTKVSVLERIAEILAPDGVLLLGHTETPDILPKTFAQLAQAPDFYVRARQPALRLASVG